ncbi:MAG: hypothetical protein Tsb0033_15380 [Winogradskyella sp.]
MFSDKVKETVQDNPFSQSYNLKKVVDIIKEEDLEKVESDTLKFLLNCHKLYVDSLNSVFKAFSSLNFAKDDLIDFFFLGVNRHFINSQNSYYKQLAQKNNTESRGVDMESLSFQKFESGHGNEISIKEVFERGGDVLNLFVSVTHEWEDKAKEHRNIGEVDGQFLFDRFGEIWMNLSQIYAFNSFYHILRDEKGFIVAQEEDSVVKIKCSDEYKEKRTMSKIGEIREASYINEYSSYLLHLNTDSKKEKTVIDCEISDGIVLPKVGKRNEEYKFIRFAQYLVSSGYFENENFEHYNIELFDIYKMLSVVEDLIKSINSKSVGLELDFSLEGIPYKIKRNTLIKTIQECINIPGESISKVLDVLTDKSETPYFWRKPFYGNAEFLYLPLPLLSAPNYRLLLESILDELQIDYNESIDRYKEYIVNEIHESNIDYKFEVVEIDNTNLPNNCLLIELKDYFLIIGVFLFKKHPIETYETKEYFENLDVFSEDLLAKSESIIEELELEKPITLAVVGNNKTFSGLKFNRIPYLDFPLLRNYFAVGEFKKARMIFKDKKVLPKVYNKISYYENEDEFNKNLLSFLIYPIPVFQRANKIIWREQLIFPDSIKPKLYMDNYDFIDEENLLENEISALNRALNFQFYNDTKDREDEIFNEHIQFYLTNIFNSLAFGKYDLSIYRYRISEIFQRSRIHGFSHLILYFTNTLEGLNHIKLKKDKRFKSIEYEKDSIMSLYSKVFSEKKEIRLYDFTIDLDISKQDEKKLISLALDYLSTLRTRKYTIDEIENYLTFLCIVRAFKTKYNLDKEFYLVSSNLISALNFDNRYQQARNLSEEILLISLNDNKLYRGWGLLFLCLEQQKNVFDSTIYGCLYLTALSVETRLNYSDFVEVFYSILKFARDKPAYHLLDGVFDLLKSIKLDDYDVQKVHLSYYLSIFNKRQESLNEIVAESIDFFRDNSKKIIKYKDNGVFPWLNYFYNLVRFKNEGIISNEFEFSDIIEELEKNLSEESKEHLQGLHFAKNDVKEAYINSLKNILLTYSYQDFIYEIQNLELVANHLIKFGVDNNDFDSVLLSGFVFNDITLTYDNTYVDKGTKIEFNLNNDIEFKHLSSYSDYIKDKILLREGQLLLYLFDFKHLVYGLTFNDKKEMEILKIPKWNLSEMNEWLKKKNKFYYDSKNYFDLNAQEEGYKETLNQLMFSAVSFNSEFKELLIATNLNLSKFPHNLILSNGDFVASNKFISNIMSVEWFIGNNQEQILDKEYTRTSWIPIEDGDPDINFAYDKLTPVFDNYDINVLTKSVPDESISTDLNIFLAHGELNQLGFKAIYKSDGVNSAVIENKQLIGSGEVAILFICNSGVINEDLFSNSVISLVHEVILSGYKAVIAPCWSLETSIPSFWLDEFLKSFNQGDYISESVFKANNKLAEYKDEISNAFYVPQGRLAMHLFGNPNIRVNIGA